MTVGAVLGVNNYDNDAYQYQIFGTVVSTERLQYLMELYGVIQTGDEYYDLRRLQEAMVSYYTKFGTFDVNQGSNKQSQEIPWADLMSQIGLTATGDKANDYALFMMTVSVMSDNATPEEKVALAGLVYQSQYVFAQPEVQQNSTEVSASDILAVVNRAFMLGGYAT